MTYDETNLLWITLKIGTDIVPLLANLCSKQCEDALPKPPENYVQFLHKGGRSFVQSALYNPDKDNLKKLKKIKNY